MATSAAAETPEAARSLSLPESTLADAGGRQEPAGGQGDKYDLVDGARDAGASDELWPARA
jgi:hypothetical protein